MGRGEEVMVEGYGGGIWWRDMVEGYGGGIWWKGLGEDVAKKIGKGEVTGYWIGLGGELWMDGRGCMSVTA